ncbi:MAG: hypothetical protein WBL25_19640 [Anaerolineales bacterium]
MSKKTVAILSLMLLTSALLGSSVLTRGHFWGDDFAAYIMQAKSILTGDMDEFVASNTFTVTQSSEQIGPAAYPWGFPLMLTPVYALIGLSPLGLKFPGLMAYLAFLLVFFFLIKRRFTLTESLLAFSLFAFNPELLRFLDNILSDMPFLFLSTLALLLADLYIHETRKKRRWILATITGAAIFAAYFVRTQGLILLASMLLFQAIRFLRQDKERRSIIVETLLTVATFGALLGISSLIFPGGQSSYLSLYSGFSLELLINNIVSYSQLFGEFFSSLPGQELFFGIFAVLFFVGLITRFKTDLLFILYIALYLLVLWTWPEWQGYRFILPMLPLFIYFTIQGIRATLSKIGESKKELLRKGIYAYLLLIVILFAYKSGANAYGNLRVDREINGPFDPLSLETYDFIRNETPPESVIVFFKPRAMHLMTGRNALALTECDRISDGDYLALSKKVGENLQIPPDQIDECNLPLEKVYENRRFIVYKLLD